MTARADRGTSLIELVAVLAIFSIVAVMALQGLGAAISARERLVAAEAESAALAGTTALLRRDLQAMLPVPGTDGGAAFVAGDGGVDLTLAGQPDFPDGGRGGLVRVSWRLEDGRLSREVQPFGAEATVGTVLLDGVAGWQVRSRSPDGAWRDAGAADRSGSRALPSAVEVAFDLPAAPGILLLVAR